MRSDAELLTAWRAGDRGAGDALMQRHYASVLRYFELNATWAAEDLAQRTFMACIERVDAVRDTAAFRAYLMGIARRLLARHQRDLSRRRLPAGFDGPTGRTRLSTLVARNREQMLVLRALAALPRRAQLLLILFYWDGVGTPALADSFGVTPSTIRSRLLRARDLLRTRMAKMATSGAPTPGDDDAVRDALMSVVPDELSARGGS